MARYSWVCLSGPRAGSEAEFIRWYEDEHIPQILAIQGFVEAKRFKIDPALTQGVAAQPWRFMVIYELETDDIGATLASVTQAVEAGRMLISGAVDLDLSLMVAAQPIAD